MYELHISHKLVVKDYITENSSSDTGNSVLFKTKKPILQDETSHFSLYLVLPLGTIIIFSSKNIINKKQNKNNKKKKNQQKKVWNQYGLIYKYKWGH